MDPLKNKIEHKKIIFFSDTQSQNILKVVKKESENFLATIGFSKNRNEIKEVFLINLDNTSINDEIVYFWKAKILKNVIVLTKNIIQKVDNSKLDWKSIFLKMAVDKENAVIVNLDSITSFLTIRKNKVIGKIIAPGLDLGKKSLVENTSLINDFKGYYFDSVLTSGTEKAVSAGVVLNQVGMIEYVVNQIEKKLKIKTPVVLTGINYKHIEDHLELNFVYQWKEDLLLKGVANFYQELKKQSSR